MQRLLCLIALICCCAAQPARADASGEAAAAAAAWLRYVDAGDYAASYDTAAAVFRAAVAKPRWAEMAATVRSPLGAVVKRTLRSAGYTTSVPGAPPGEYVVLVYDTAFERGAGHTETVTPTRDRDGAWRVSGYYVR